ncbi:Hypothetical protein D9617_7g029340 [Elsinoe fawcettii]|nr:Hypothetical protein D9617_7g029340 [Elsinoe fawcettii]
MTNSMLQDNKPAPTPVMKTCNSPALHNHEILTKPVDLATSLLDCIMVGRGTLMCILYYVVVAQSTTPPCWSLRDVSGNGRSIKAVKRQRKSQSSPSSSLRTMESTHVPTDVETKETERIEQALKEIGAPDQNISCPDKWCFEHPLIPSCFMEGHFNWCLSHHAPISVYDPADLTYHLHNFTALSEIETSSERRASKALDASGGSDGLIHNNLFSSAPFRYLSGVEAYSNRSADRSESSYALPLSRTRKTTISASDTVVSAATTAASGCAVTSEETQAAATSPLSAGDETRQELSGDWCLVSRPKEFNQKVSKDKQRGTAPGEAELIAEPESRTTDRAKQKLGGDKEQHEDKAMTANRDVGVTDPNSLNKDEKGLDAEDMDGKCVVIHHFGRIVDTDKCQWSGQIPLQAGQE